MALGRTLASRPTFLGVGKGQCLTSTPWSSMVPKHPYSQTASPAFVDQANLSSLHPHLEFPWGWRGHPQPCPRALSIKYLPRGDQTGRAEEVACCFFCTVSLLVLVLLGWKSLACINASFPSRPLACSSHCAAWQGKHLGAGKQQSASAH